MLELNGRLKIADKRDKLRNNPYSYLLALNKRV